jgi:hypothetical protein
MISQAIAEVGVGVLAGGGLQFVSEGMKIVGKLVSGLSAAAIASDEAKMKLAAAESESQDKAAKRLPWKITSAVVLIVIITIYLLPYLVGYLEAILDTDITTTLVSEKEPWLNIFGLIKLGGGLVLQEASGIVQIPEVRSIANLTGGMVLGGKFLSTR